MSFFRKKGFTLLELMIVIVIVGILASLALPRFITAKDKAIESEARSTLGSIRASQLRYFAENDAYTGTLADLDVEFTISGYYDYDAVDGTGDILGTATKLDAADSYDDLEIEEDGEISVQ